MGLAGLEALVGFTLLAAASVFSNLSPLPAFSRLFWVSAFPGWFIMEILCPVYVPFPSKDRPAYHTYIPPANRQPGGLINCRTLRGAQKHWTQYPIGLFLWAMSTVVSHNPRILTWKLWTCQRRRRGTVKCIHSAKALFIDYLGVHAGFLLSTETLDN